MTPEDTYWPAPRASYDERRQQFLEYCAPQSTSGRTGFFSQILRLELGRDAVDEGPIREGIAFVDSREDCCDFAVAGLVRILYRFHDSPLISRQLIADIEACLLRFKYWWDEPAGDNKRCYWTENHQIIFHCDELLAGQLFRDQKFGNDGKSGAEHMQHALHLIRRWIEFRIRFGFSEWLSHCYFEEDLLALVNLYDYAEQEDVKRNAGLLIDVILFEMALHTYRGVMGCSHGRTYPRFILGGRLENSACTAKLMLGMGLYNQSGPLGTTMLATSTYRCPAIFEKIAADLNGPVLIEERHSFDMDDIPSLGLSYTNTEDVNLYWSVQDYTHEKVYPLSQWLTNTTGIWLDREQYLPRYAQIRDWQVTQYGRVVDPNLDCHAMTEVHIQTYRTGNYMLSCAQDYRPGKPGYQQHPWQATLGIDAMVYTSHPASDNVTSRPNYWAGNGILPRAVQHKNVLVCLHHLPATDAFPFSHAYFPKAAFDEVVEQNGWICARKDDGYLALHVSQPYRWMNNEKGETVEVRADAPDVAWVVEMGEQGQWADFGSFVQAVTRAKLSLVGLQVEYESPSQGKISFGWHEDLVVKGAPVALHSYPRFENPYCKNDFLARKIEVGREGEKYVMEFGE
jgi:hypothetical protein